MDLEQRAIQLHSGDEICVKPDCFNFKPEIGMCYSPVGSKWCVSYNFSNPKAYVTGIIYKHRNWIQRIFTRKKILQVKIKII